LIVVAKGGKEAVEKNKVISPLKVGISQ
jgi:hypothetical protein